MNIETVVRAAYQHHPSPLCSWHSTDRNVSHRQYRCKVFRKSWGSYCVNVPTLTCGLLKQVVFVQVFMKSVKLEWCRGEVDNALRLLDEAVKHYPDFPKVVFVSVCVGVCVSVSVWVGGCE